MTFMRVAVASAEAVAAVKRIAGEPVQVEAHCFADGHDKLRAVLRWQMVGDPESFKVRRGKVGGFTDYLNGDDLAYANEAMRKLDARFGCA